MTFNYHKFYSGNLIPRDMQPRDVVMVVAFTFPVGLPCYLNPDVASFVKHQALPIMIMNNIHYKMTSLFELLSQFFSFYGYCATL